MIKHLIKKWMESAGYAFVDRRQHYVQDGLLTIHNDSFRSESGFQAAYQRGIVASGGHDPQFEWRVHVALWAATHAIGLPGDFVECGVNAGFMSSAILYHVEWNKHDKRFFLVDTFAGPVLSQFSDEEIRRGRQEIARSTFESGGYHTDLDRIRANFSGWKDVMLVPGTIPEVLPSVPVETIAYLHIDLNCAYPEQAALRHFWPKLVPGALVLLDDYAFTGYEAQKAAMDEVAAECGAHILSIPTGQGLILKR